MQFNYAETNINYNVLRMVSQHWEIGITAYLFGYRICANPIGSSFYSINYCAGVDRTFIFELLHCIQNILSTFPEDATAHDVESIMPKYRVKPINNDPCWDALKKLEEQRVLAQAEAS